MKTPNHASEKSLAVLIACARHGCAAERVELKLRAGTLTRTIIPNLKPPAAIRRARALLARINGALT